MRGRQKCGVRSPSPSATDAKPAHVHPRDMPCRRLAPPDIHLRPVRGQVLAVFKEETETGSECEEQDDLPF